MGTFYVNRTAGSDGTAAENDISKPFRTLTGAVDQATDSADVVEITDEATYTLSNEITIRANNVTITHTASNLGRPVIDATARGNGHIINMKPSATRTGLVLNGLEIKGSGDQAMELFTMNIGNNSDGIKITDCFMYDIGCISDRYLDGTTTTMIVSQSSFMFTDRNFGGFAVAANGKFEISNCFLSGTRQQRPLLEGNGTQTHSTASFCTLIYNVRTSAGGSGVNVIGGWGKAINCVVSASGHNIDGIDALDHSFNVVNVTTGVPYLNGSNTSESAGTGDQTDTITFLNNGTKGHTETIVSNYALVAGSTGVDQGTSFDGITIDINNVSRPQGTAFDMGAFELLEPYWQDDDNNERYSRKFGPSLQIRATENKLLTRRFPRRSINRQAPFFVTIAGPAALRERSGSYKNVAGQIKQLDGR